MLTLAALARLAAEHGDCLDSPVTPFTISGQPVDTDANPIVMGCINLSRDSTYRDSIAPSPAAAARRGRVLAAQGAAIVDIGAESTTLRAPRVDADAQAQALVPVVSELSRSGVVVSVETYHPSVAAACLAAGAGVVNLTGSAHDADMLALAAEHGAAIVLCFSPAPDVRSVVDVELDADPVPALVDHFGPRVEAARSAGVVGIAVDPGMGFYYGNLVDPAVRVRHQARVLLNSFRLRPLGVPVCNALPHAFDLFESEFRTAESFFAVLARLGRTGILRTHEVSKVAAVVAALAAVD